MLRSKTFEIMVSNSEIYVIGWHESWNSDIREDLDVTNEQATLFYRINSQDRPQTYHHPPLSSETDNIGESLVLPEFM